MRSGDFQLRFTYHVFTREFGGSALRIVFNLTALSLKSSRSPMVAVTGATGNLGRLVIEHLLDREVSPSDIVAAVRSPEKAADLADRGVEVRKADYNEPETLDAAYRRGMPRR